MNVKRYDFGTQYTGNTGAPAIIEKSDGKYVSFQDYADLAVLVDAIGVGGVSVGGASVVQEPVEWDEAVRITDLPEVDEILRGFIEDPTGDNGIEVVRAVLHATGYTAPQPPTSAWTSVPKYTSSIGHAGQAYLDNFKHAHPLPTQFRWADLWMDMCKAAAPTPPADGQTQPTVDWEAMYDQMCERCESLDRKLAEYEEQQDADKGDTRPLEPVAEIAVYNGACTAIGDLLSARKLSDGSHLLYTAAQLSPAMAGDRNEQIIAAMTLIKQDYGPESTQTTRPREYVHNAVMQLIDAGYQRVQPERGMVGDEITDEEIHRLWIEHKRKSGAMGFARALLKRVQPASEDDAIRAKLKEAANYIDALDGDSKPYRITMQQERKP